METAISPSTSANVPATSVQTSAPILVYVASARSNEVAAFVFDDIAGSLELVQRLATPAPVTPIAVRPDRRTLYAGMRSDQPSIGAFTIDPADGALSLYSSTRIADPSISLATDRGGNYLMTASYSAARIAIHALRSDGSTEIAVASEATTPPLAHCIVPDPSNRFIFVSSLGGNVILQFVFDAITGRLSPNIVPFVTAPTGSGPRHITFHPSHDVVYVNGELDGSLIVYDFNPDSGCLKALGHIPILAADARVVPWGAELVVTPDGRFLYVSERRTSTLAVFDLRADPRRPQRTAVMQTEDQPRSFAIDTTGRFVIVAGEKSNVICVYEIDEQTGRLVARRRYPVGEKPVWVTIVDSNRTAASR